MQPSLIHLCLSCLKSKCLFDTDTFSIHCAVVERDNISKERNKRQPTAKGNLWNGMFACLSTPQHLVPVFPSIHKKMRAQPQKGVKKLEQPYV